jgi:hypothetical protein
MNMSPDTEVFKQFQDSFAARIRDPEGAPLPEQVPERRMRAYEELVFNNIEGFLLSCYPITRKLLDDEQWEEIVRRFVIEHRCATPLFREIPKEFLVWLGDKFDQLLPSMPFLHEFMHYEWLELDVSISPAEVDLREIDINGDYIDAIPVLNPTAQLACYYYPVHKIGPQFQPQQSDGQAHCYLLYRDVEDRVQFIQLNPVSARLVELLQQQEITGRAALLQIAGEINHQEPDALVELGRNQLQEFLQAGVLLGTRRSS